MGEKEESEKNERAGAQHTRKRKIQHTHARHKLQSLRLFKVERLKSNTATMLERKREGGSGLVKSRIEGRTWVSRCVWGRVGEGLNVQMRRPGTLFLVQGHKTQAARYRWLRTLRSTVRRLQGMCIHSERLLSGVWYCLMQRYGVPSAHRFVKEDVHRHLGSRSV